MSAIKFLIFVACAISCVASAQIAYSGLYAGGYSPYAYSAGYVPTAYSNGYVPTAYSGYNYAGGYVAPAYRAGYYY